MHYKNFMRVVGGLLMRDSHDVDDISQEEIQRRLDIFVTDAYDVESELANVRYFIFNVQIITTIFTLIDIFAT